MLSTQADPLPSPVTHYIKSNPVLIHTGKGWRGGGEPVRKLEGCYFHKKGPKIPTWLTVSPVCKLFYTPVKMTFRVFIVIWSMVQYNVRVQYTVDYSAVWEEAFCKSFRNKGATTAVNKSKFCKFCDYCYALFTISKDVSTEFKCLLIHGFKF